MGILNGIINNSSFLTSNDWQLTLRHRNVTHFLNIIYSTSCRWILYLCTLCKNRYKYKPAWGVYSSYHINNEFVCYNIVVVYIYHFKCFRKLLTEFAHIPVTLCFHTSEHCNSYFEFDKNQLLFYIISSFQFSKF